MIHCFPPRSALHLECPSMSTGSKACLGPHGAGRAPLPADRIQALHPGEKSPKRLIKGGISKTRCCASSTNTRTNSQLCCYMVRHLSLSERLLEIPPPPPFFFVTESKNY